MSRNDNFNDLSQGNMQDNRASYSNCDQLLFFKRVIAQEKCRDQAPYHPNYFLTNHRAALHSWNDCLTASKAVIEQAEKCIEMNKP